MNSTNTPSSEEQRAASGPNWRDLEQIISEKEYAEMENVSVDTVRRRAARGEGPKRLRLSPRRVGYRLGDIIRHRESA